MDDLRFDALPRSRASDALVAAIERGDDVARVVAAAAATGDDVWRAAAEGHALRDAIASLVSALPSEPERRERSIAAVLCDGFGEIGFFAATAGLAARLADARDGDVGEITRLAALEGFAAALERALDGGEDGQVGDALAEMCALVGFRALVREVLARLGVRLAGYVLDRELPQHVGEGKRFSSTPALRAFRLAIEAHVRRAAERATAEVAVSTNAEWIEHVGACVLSMRRALGAVA
jgi:hypothetical protein